jgi:hypothetical protein
MFRTGGAGFQADAVIVDGANGNESIPCRRRGVRPFFILIGGWGRTTSTAGPVTTF